MTRARQIAHIFDVTVQDDSIDSEDEEDSHVMTKRVKIRPSPH